MSFEGFYNDFLIERQMDVDTFFDMMDGRSLDDATQILLRKGKQIGEGIYSRVFQGDGEVVIKLNDGDVGFENYVDIMSKHSHTLHPRVLKHAQWKNGDKNIHAYALEYVSVDGMHNRRFLEDQLGRGSVIRSLTDLIGIFEFSTDPNIVSQYLEGEGFKEGSLEFIDYFREWFWGIRGDINKGEVVVDLHRNNWGFNKTGDIKLIDPFALKVSE